MLVRIQSRKSLASKIDDAYWWKRRELIFANLRYMAINYSVFDDSFLKGFHTSMNRLFDVEAYAPKVTADHRYARTIWLTIDAKFGLIRAPVFRMAKNGYPARPWSWYECSLPDMSICALVLGAAIDDAIYQTRIEDQLLVNNRTHKLAPEFAYYELKRLKIRDLSEVECSIAYVDTERGPRSAVKIQLSVRRLSESGKDLWRVTEERTLMMNA